MKTTYKALFTAAILLLVVFSIQSFTSIIDVETKLDQSYSKVENEDNITSLKTKLPTLMVKHDTTSVAIKMSKLNITTTVIGNIATTRMDMTFYNDSNQVLSGELYFPLNEGQTISQFALEVNNKLRDGVAVEKAKGRAVYESTIRRRVDPGLVELTKGNNFKTRIYPIPAKGTKRVVVSYEQELINTGSDIYYQLPLYFNEKIDDFSLTIEVESSNLPKTKDGNLSNFKFKEWNETYRAFFEEKDFFSQQELIINIPQDDESISTIVEKSKNGDHFFYQNIKPEIYKQEKEDPKSICVIWDVSNSASNRDLEKERMVLADYLSKISNCKLRLITFSNEVNTNQTLNSKQELLSALENQIYDGATQIGIIPFQSIQEEEIILVSDIIHTFGDKNVDLPNRPIHVINSSTGADYSLQKLFSLSTGGQVINLSAFTVDESVNQLLRTQYQFISLEILEGEIIESYPKLNKKITSNFSFAGILKSQKGKVKLNFGFGNTIVWSKTITIDPENSLSRNKIARRVWAEKKIEDMNVNYEENKEEITALGKAFSIVTKNTSLIVLDDINDYVTNEIIPPTELLEEYNRRINTKNQTLTTSLDNKMARVKTSWDARVTWWNKEFKIPKPKKEYDWQNSSGEDSNDRVDAERRRPVLEGVTPSDGAVQSERMDSYSPADAADAAGEASWTVEEMSEDVESESFGLTSGYIAADELGNSTGTYEWYDLDKSVEGKAKETTKKIEIQEWKPDNEIYNTLTELDAINCYPKYIELKKNNNSPMFYADAARVLHSKERGEEALRVLSNLAEMELENHELLKTLANTLMNWKEVELATFVFQEILEQREEEPQSYRDLGLALHKLGKDQEAIEMLYQVVEKDWNGRFPEIENIVLGEINCIISTSKNRLNTDFIDSDLIDDLPVDVRIVIDWDADNLDIDLWVTDPAGEKCFFSHPDTKIGGHMSRDFTRGYGPEEFLIKKGMKGKYKIEINYYGTSQQKITGPPTIKAKLVTNYGLSTQKEETIILRMKEKKSIVYIGEMELS